MSGQRGQIHWVAHFIAQPRQNVGSKKADESHEDVRMQWACRATTPSQQQADQPGALNSSPHGRPHADQVPDGDQGWAGRSFPGLVARPSPREGMAGSCSQTPVFCRALSIPNLPCGFLGQFTARHRIGSSVLAIPVAGTVGVISGRVQALKGCPGPKHAVVQRQQQHHSSGGLMARHFDYNR